MSETTLSELSDRLINLIRSTDDTLKVCFFLNKHNENVKSIINTVGATSRKTPLMVACELSQSVTYGYETLNLFLSFQPDVNITDADNKSALVHSIPSDYFKATSHRTGKEQQKNQHRYHVCKELVQHGADVNIRLEHGRTLLMRAVSSSREFIDLIIRSGAHLDAQDDRGRTALMYYVDKSSPKVAYLLDKKADVFIRDEYGNTAIDFVHINQSTRFILELVRAYLKPLSSFEFEKLDMKGFLKEKEDAFDRIFPIKDYHLSALKILNKLSLEKFDRPSIDSTLDFVFYLTSEEFKRSVHLNVIAPIKKTIKKQIDNNKKKQLIEQLDLTIVFLKECKEMFMRLHELREKIGLNSKSKSTDTTWKWLTLKLANIELKSLQSYFEQSSYADIQQDMKEWIKETKELFPIKAYCLSLLDDLIEIAKSDHLVNISYLRYFAGLDFLEKIHYMCEESDRIDGVLEEANKQLKSFRLKVSKKVATDFLAKSQQIHKLFMQSRKLKNPEVTAETLNKILFI